MAEDPAEMLLNGGVFQSQSGIRRQSIRAYSCLNLELVEIQCAAKTMTDEVAVAKTNTATQLGTEWHKHSRKCQA